MPEFHVKAAGEVIHMAIRWAEDGTPYSLARSVRSGPFLLRIRLFAAKRRLYRSYRKFQKIRHELDEK